MTEHELTTRLEAAETIVRQAGQLAAGLFAERASLPVMEKGVHDRVTEADRRTELFIREALEKQFPGEPIMGEEYGAADTDLDRLGGEGLWIIDPIDGTDCFVFGLPMWSVAVAWVQDGQARIGLVYDPVHDDMYAAAAGHGARLNEERIAVSDATDLTAGLVGIGYSTRVTREVALTNIDRLIQRGGVFHRCGSGALSLAWVAAGRLVGYYEPHMNAWDCVAAMLLVTEAGGWTNDFVGQGGLIKGGEVYAAAPGVIDDIKFVGGFGGASTDAGTE